MLPRQGTCELTSPGSVDDASWRATAPLTGPSSNLTLQPSGKGNRHRCKSVSPTPLRDSQSSSLLRADRRALPDLPISRIEVARRPPPTPHPSPRSLSPSVHSPSLPTPWTAREHSRSPADFASSPPWISNPPHPKLNHLPSSLSTPPITATTPTSPGILDSPAVGLSLVQTRPHRGTPSSEHRFLRPRAQIDCK